jgi:SLED domain
MSTSIVLFSVCVYINRGCRCGPVLSPKRVAQLPDQLGPGSIRRVLRGAVQACVDCSYDQSTVYNLLRDGNGRVVITGRILHFHCRC